MPLMFLRDDITRVHCDAIVNAANETLLGGGGVDGAIHHAAGPELLEECRTLGGCAVGDAKKTRGYMLPCRYVIHTVGPRWMGGTRGEPELLASCYRRSLEVALEAQCESVAFPMISTGVYGYPQKEAMAVAVQTVRAFLDEHDMDVYFVVFGARSVEAGLPYADTFRSYIDDHYAFVHEDSEEQRFRQLNRLNRESVRFQAMREESLEEVLAKPAVGFTEALFRLIDQRGMKDSDCYRAANLTRMHFAKLRSGGKPGKSTVFALAFALKLSVEEARQLLATAGFAFEPASRLDVAVEYLLRHQKYDIISVNAILFDLDLPQLGCVAKGIDE